MFRIFHFLDHIEYWRQDCDTGSALLVKHVIVTSVSFQNVISGSLQYVTVGVDGFDVDLGESIFESLEVNCQDNIWW